VIIWSDKGGGGAQRRQSGKGKVARADTQGGGGFGDLTFRDKLNAEGPLVDVRFAPPAFGLKIATVTADGKAKVAECNNVLALQDWEPTDLDTAGRASERATAQAASESSPDGGNVAGVSAALDWIRTPIGGSLAGDDCGETLAVGGRGGKLSIWVRSAKNQRWTETTSVVAHPMSGGHGHAIKDVAWCPNLCRSYEIVATCGVGARLWKVEVSAADEGKRPSYGRVNESGVSVKISLLKDLVLATDQVGTVWRCSWNLTGTSLALCPEDCEVSVWRCDAALEWHQETAIAMSEGSGTS